ncbi:flagellar biosynthesis protein FliQ [bacterium]|nr:flagellar biosynthesis protein FliQ [bacterium]
MLILAAEVFDDGYVLTLCTKALYLVLILSAPMLMSALSVGLMVSIVQATTQVQEQTLSFVPKIVATFMAIVLCGTWMFNMLSTFTIATFSDISRMGPH